MVRKSNLFLPPSLTVKHLFCHKMIERKGRETTRGVETLVRIFKINSDTLGILNFSKHTKIESKSQVESSKFDLAFESIFLDKRVMLN